MISEPSPEVLRSTDWEALRALETRADQLLAGGQLDAQAFGELWAAGLLATKNHPELLQTLDMLRPADARQDFDESQARDPHGMWTRNSEGERIYKTPPVKAGSEHAKSYTHTIPGAEVLGKSFRGVRKDLIHEVHVFDGVSGLHAIVVRKDGIKVYQQTDEAKQRAADKRFGRALVMSDKLGGIRSAYQRDLTSSDPAARQNATVLGLIDQHVIRIGGSSAEDRTGSRGATTIEAKHVHPNPDGSVQIRFPGKSGVRWNVKVTDPQLAQNLREAAAGKRPSEKLFPETSPQSVNAYIGEKAGTKLTAKDFRTFHASVIAHAELEKLRPPKNAKELKANMKKAIAATAKVMGHTPAVCKSSYINPRLLNEYEERYAPHA